MVADFTFTLDAAASAETARASAFFTKAHEALSADWGAHPVWCNPPYGDAAARLSDWVKKAHSAAHFGATVVLLIPARTNTSWFHDYCLRDGEIRFIRGRPRFGGAHHGLPQPLCFVIFRPPAQPVCAGRRVTMPSVKETKEQMLMDFGPQETSDTRR
jgi:phage N-6-adenine-methyltransferase